MIERESLWKPKRADGPAGTAPTVATASSPESTEAPERRLHGYGLSSSAPSFSGGIRSALVTPIFSAR